MKDLEFKALKHECRNFGLYSTGTAIERNYNPDSVLKYDDEFVIIEHETEPNRKTIIADIFKAAYFLQKEKKGILVIVLTPKGKSSFESYPKHCLPYFSWLKERTNLEDVYFVHEKKYFYEDKVLVIKGDDFEQNSISPTRARMMCRLCVMASRAFVLSFASVGVQHSPIAPLRINKFFRTFCDIHLRSISNYI